MLTSYKVSLIIFLNLLCFLTDWTFTIESYTVIDDPLFHALSHVPSFIVSEADHLSWFDVSTCSDEELSICEEVEASRIAIMIVEVAREAAVPGEIVELRVVVPIAVDLLIYGCSEESVNVLKGWGDIAFMLEVVLCNWSECLNPLLVEDEVRHCSHDVFMKKLRSIRSVLRKSCFVSQQNPKQRMIAFEFRTTLILMTNIVFLMAFLITVLIELAS
jgi:hypothetical protein